MNVAVLCWLRFHFQ